MQKRLGGILLLLASLLALAALIPLAVGAQTGPTASATLSRPNIEAFPLVKAFLDVRDASGRFIHGLTASTVRVLEDGSLLPVSELRELHPGVQAVFALNPGPSFSVRNSQGASRLDIILQALSAWGASRAGSTLDDLSLAITGGIGISHVNNPHQWLAALKSLQIDPRNALPGLDILSRAVDLAADTPPRSAMGKAVLFVTPPIEAQTEISVEGIAARAAQNGVKIFIWMVPVPGAYTPNEEQLLRDLASKTGGQLFTYTDGQNLPDLEAWWEPLRSIYDLAYQSQVKSSGSHQVVVEVQTATGAISTPAQGFEIDLQPPDPAFVSPPLEINRRPPAIQDTQQGSESSFEEYAPKEEQIQVLVGYPDERVRPLARTSFFVDGQLMDENLKAPFDRFTWDLSGYDTSATHTIRVDAEDSLGLIGASIERLVQVNVITPTRSPWSWITRNVPVLSILVVVIAGSVLVLVLVLGGRLRPRTAGAPRRARRRDDPVTQPIPVQVEAPARHFPNWVNRLQWPQRHIAPKAFAFLSRISESGGETTPTPIPITTDEITLGSDPNQATLVLNDPSVEALHARLLHKDDGSFRLADEGSIAGTWINFTPVSKEGSGLEHGDLVHIGRVGFRFTLNQPTRLRKPVVTPTENPLSD
jgi:hypothetical protein